MFQNMITPVGATGGGITYYNYTINAINTPVISEEIKNGVIVCTMGTSTTGNYGQVTFYGTIKDGVVTVIQSSYGSSLPIDGVYISFSYNTTTHKFTYSTKNGSYYLGAMSIYVASSMKEG